MEKILSIIMLLAATSFGYAAPAPQADADRDPFYSGGPRSAASGSVAQDRDWGRDPFNKPFEGKTQPAATPGGDQARGKGLTGIIYGKNARLAIIGGETYKEGSRIGDRKLVDIRRHSVVFMNDAGGREEVFLEDFSIKK
jgi:hypothetical protein